MQGPFGTSGEQDLRAKCTWCLATIVIQVDGRCSSAVQPARDQLQGDVSLPYLLGLATQAHICRSCIDLQPQACGVSGLLHACHALSTSSIRRGEGTLQE